MATTGGLLACLPRAPRDPEPRPSSLATSALTLDEIAEIIDPGPQAPLSDGLPPEAFEILGLEQNPSMPGAALLGQSVAEQDLISRTVDDAQDGADFIALARSSARSVVLAEQAAQRGAAEVDVLVQLERAYRAMDVPALANDQNVLMQFMAAFMAESAAQGGPDAALFELLVQAAERAMRAAGPLHRRTVAQLLRVAPDDDAVPTALLAVAEAELGAGHEWTVPVAKLAVERRGTLATASEQLALARVCLEGLDISCGEEALRAAAGAEGSDDVAEDLTRARRVVELDDATTLEDRLERARALLELERYATAKDEFEALHREFPQDARPVVGLALHEIEKEFDFAAAHRIIESQENPKNRDEEYYELAIGTRMMAVIANVLPKAGAQGSENAAGMLETVLRDLRPDIEGYVALGNSDARVLAFVLDAVEEILAEYEATDEFSLRHLASLSDGVVALQSELPANPHAYRLLMSVAALDPDKSRAAKMAGVPAPAGPEHEALVLRRARALIDLAVTWSDADFAAQARDALREVDAASSAEAAEMHADAMLVAGQLGAPVDWHEVGNAYLSLLDDNMTAEDARALNNAGFAGFKIDSPSGPLEAWTLSSQLAEDHGDVGALNLIVLGTPGGDAAALSAMRALADKTTDSSVEVTALAWIDAWSKGKKGRREAQAAMKAALEEAKRQGPRPTAPDPNSGLVLEGAVQSGLGYSSEPGLEIRFDVSGLPWAILAPRT